MEINDFVKCIHNYDGSYLPLLIGKSYQILDIIIDTYLLKDDDDNFEYYPSYYFIDLKKYREEQLNKLLNGKNVY